MFDAAGGPSQSTTHDTLSYGVEVVYEAVETADTYIEGTVQQTLSEPNPPMVRTSKRSSALHRASGPMAPSQRPV